MIIVRVELWSAITGKTTELARMAICNTGTGDIRHGDYKGMSFRGRSKEQLDNQTPMKVGEIKNWPRLDFHVWNLVAKMLKEMGYTKGQ